MLESSEGACGPTHLLGRKPVHVSFEWIALEFIRNDDAAIDFEYSCLRASGFADPHRHEARAAGDPYSRFLGQLSSRGVGEALESLGPPAGEAPVSDVFPAGDGEDVPVAGAADEGARGAGADFSGHGLDSTRVSP